MATLAPEEMSSWSDVEARADPRELRHCIRDLVALSTLPAIWRNYGPEQIVESAAAALLAMLNVEFVHISLPGSRGLPAVEVTRTTSRVGATPEDSIVSALAVVPSEPATNAVTAILNPWGAGTMHVISAPIGFGGAARLIAGSRHADFPSQAQRLLLGVCANDVTIGLQRWHAETEQRRFLTLVERSSDFVGVASLDGVAQYINPAGLKLVGLARDDAVGLNILDFVLPEERERVREVWPIVMNVGRWVGELRFRNFETGAAIPVLVDAFRIDDLGTGQPMNIATVSRDLRPQKRAEAQLRHLNETLEQRVSVRTSELNEATERLMAEIGHREKKDAQLHEMRLELFHAARLSTAGQLAATLAHELNQPLTAAANSISAARRLLTGTNAEAIETAREVMAEATQQTLRAGRIVRRLREFVTRGECEMTVEPVAGLVERACVLALADSQALGVKVDVRLDPKASQVLANGVQVQQVLANLLRNGLEAMSGSARRDLVIATSFVHPDTIEFAISDSGHGVPADVEAHLFEPFVTTKKDGMGLGLSICRTIVEAHGGRLRHERNSDGGATFHFTLAAVARERGTERG